MAQTQKSEANLARLIESALWIRWGRKLDEPYWRKVHELDNEYLHSNFRDNMILGRFREKSMNAIDHEPVLGRLNALSIDAYAMNLMSVRDKGFFTAMPVVRTVDLWEFIQLASQRGPEVLMRQARRFELPAPLRQSVSSELLKQATAM